MEKILVNLGKEIVSLVKNYGADAVWWLVVLLYFIGIVYPDFSVVMLSNPNNVLILGLVYLGVRYFNSKKTKDENTKQNEDFQTECKERFLANVNIKTELARLKSDIQADRIYIMEYHNGKSNAGSNMPFLYVDMTYEETGMRTDFISQECQNMNTSIFNFPEYMAKNLWFIGDTKQLVDVDFKIAHRMEDNNVKYCAAILLKNKNNLVGILGASYNDTPKIEDAKILQIMSIYSQTICGHLIPNSFYDKKEN